MSKIICAGDHCVDRYLFSDRLKFNPESNAPCYDIDHSMEKGGMVFNVTENLNNMNNEVYTITDSGTKITKTRLYFQDECIARIDDDQISSNIDRIDLVVPLNSILRRYDGIVVSDYGKGFWQEDTLSYLSDIKAQVFIDPSSNAKLEEYPYATAIVPNLKEAQDLTGETEVFKMCEKLSIAAEYVVLKAGDKGAFLYTNGWDKLRHFPAQTIDVVDPCGCGDTFIAALATLYTEGYSIAKAIEGANKAAAITAQRLGVSSPTSTEWNEIVSSLDK